MRVLEKVKRDFWEEIAQNCGYATFFHTPYWSDLMSQTFPYIDITKGFIFDDGTRVVFPFMQKKGAISRGFLNEYVSGPPYTYGGPISDRELGQGQYNEIIKYINVAFQRYSRILIRGNPYRNNFNLNGFQEVKDLSHVAEIGKCANEEDLFKSYGKRYRSYIRKAIKSNALKVKEAKSFDEYEKLYMIYKKSIKYWDKDRSRYPLRLFRNIYNLKCKHIKLWGVKYKTNMIGGDVTFCWKNKCFMWLSYHDREYSKLHHRRYMLHHVFLDCKERAISFYDFLQSGGIKSQEAFKRSMGGKEYPHSAWMKENSLVKLAKRVRDIKRDFW